MPPKKRQVSQEPTLPTILIKIPILDKPTLPTIQKTYPGTYLPTYPLE